MKIDIHTHTKRCKKGDAPTREISPEDFCEHIGGTDVRIVAITNHNVFDLEQFDAILGMIDSGVQVWPGIELDITDGEGRGHLLVLVSSTHAGAFDQAVSALTASISPDDFTTSISEVLESFDTLGPIYAAHYRQKKPNLSEAALESLTSGTAHPSRVLKEVTNATSAGIYISHGYASIYGSDVTDWARYQEAARGLPDLRLPVESFEHFCLLLEKDPTTINTALDRKAPEELVLQPFEDESFLKLRFFNDINVVFGAKGTGKSCILRAVEEYYTSNGIEAHLFESGGADLDEACDIKGKSLKYDLTSHGLDAAQDAIKWIRGAKEMNVTAFSKYVQYFSATTTNRNAKRLRLKDIDREEHGSAERHFDEVATAEKRTAEFLAFIREDSTIRAELDDQELTTLEELLASLSGRLKASVWEAFCAWKETELLNSAVEKVGSEITRKTGNPKRPAKTGFREYGLNRCRMDYHASTVVSALKAPLPVESEVIGSLGEEKGDLWLRTEYRFQDGGVRDRAFSPVAKVKKSSIQSVASTIGKIRTSAYRQDLFERVAQLNKIDDVDLVQGVDDLLLFNRRYELAGEPYTPSTGESAMVLLEQELRRDADIYILDEPEKGLGNEYISQVIVPLIKGHALAGKRVFISTHDANIAVRTLPYCSVYRSHDAGGYRTYSGNPFSNDLLNIDDESDALDWRQVSMKTLEGGEDAFGERGRIYGAD
jgi:predicted ATPase